MPQKFTAVKEGGAHHFRPWLIWGFQNSPTRFW